MSKQNWIAILGVTLLSLGLLVMYATYEGHIGVQKTPSVYIPMDITKGVIYDSDNTVEFSFGTEYKELLQMNNINDTIAGTDTTYYIMTENPILKIYYIASYPEAPTAANLEDIFGTYKISYKENVPLLIVGSSTAILDDHTTLSRITINGKTIELFARSYKKVYTTSASASVIFPPIFKASNIIRMSVEYKSRASGTFEVPAVVYSYKFINKNNTENVSVNFDAVHSIIEKNITGKETGLDYTIYEKITGEVGNKTVIVKSGTMSTYSTNITPITTSIEPYSMIVMFENFPVMNMNGTTVFYDGENKIAIVPVKASSIMFYSVSIYRNSIELSPIGTMKIESAKYTTITK